MRGGGWYGFTSYPSYGLDYSLRVANRKDKYRTIQPDNIGFRCAAAL